MTGGLSSFVPTPNNAHAALLSRPGFPYRYCRYGAKRTHGSPSASSESFSILSKKTDASVSHFSSSGSFLNANLRNLILRLSDIGRFADSLVPPPAYATSAIKSKVVSIAAHSKAIPPTMYCAYRSDILLMPLGANHAAHNISSLEPNCMTKDPTRDDVLKRMLKTPPKPFTPKAKKAPSPTKGKAKKG